MLRKVSEDILKSSKVNHINGKNQKTCFRKLPPELQQKVASKEISLNAAAIQAGIRRKPTPEETALKAFGKAENRLQVAKAIYQALDVDEAAALRQWIAGQS